MTEYVIPPIIQNWIDNLNNPQSPSHIRDNYARMLTNVNEACTIELAKYRLSQASIQNKQQRYKKKVSNV